MSGGERSFSFHGIDVHVNHLPSAKATLAFWSLLWATFFVVEWIILALSRDFQKDLQRDVALAAGVPPEDQPLTPRIRVNFKWLWMKAKQRVRGAIVYGCILPIAAIAGEIPLVGHYLQGAVIAVWAMYWAGVFTASKSAFAWNDEARAPDPIWLRALDEAIEGAWILRWWAPRLVARILRRCTRSMFSPAHKLEISPYELEGLALARALRAIPILSLFLRPVFSVAAARVVISGEEVTLRSSRASAPPVGQRIALDAPSPSPDLAAEEEAAAVVEANQALDAR